MEEYVVTVKQEPVKTNQAVVFPDDEEKKDIDIVISPEEYDKTDHGTTSPPVPNRCPPSEAQVNKLIKFMEMEPRLAKGHARTQMARARTRNQWNKIAEVLNRFGATKSGDQWSKYWKDKKGAVKRKVAHIAAARSRPACELDDAPELSRADRKVLAILGGDALTADPLAESGAPEPMHIGASWVTPPAPPPHTPPLDSTSEESTQKRPEPPQPTEQRRNTIRRLVRIPRRHIVQQRITPQPVRRRVMPYRSEIANLTERFLVLEEKRMEAQLIQARSQESIAAALTKLTDAIVTAIKQI